MYSSVLKYSTIINNRDKIISILVQNKPKTPKCYIKENNPLKLCTNIPINTIDSIGFKTFVYRTYKKNAIMTRNT